MSVTINGTTGITNDGGYTGDGVVFADTTPANTLVTTTGGNVGIGTSSPTAKLHVSAPDGTAPLTLNSAGGSDSTRALNFNVAGDNYGKILIPSGSGGAMAFWTGAANAAAERARIDSSGNLLVGCTAVPSASVEGKRIASGSGATTSSSGSSTAAYSHWTFFNGNGSVGSIQTSASATSYVTSSDYRLKENITPMIGALTKVSALKPVTYKWKIDGSDGQGFIAHELSEVVPQCVIGEKDAVDADGNPVYQGIDTSFLVATLTAAIQEQQAMIQEQSATIASLTARIEALEAA